MAAPSKPSYREQIPPDFGGQYSRQGFDFQDHVAAQFCLLMLSSNGPTEVWCETLDDITVIWSSPNGEIFEFVQAKNVHMDQLWTVAKLTERVAGVGGKKLPNSSIVERLLSRDSCKEECRFRVATSLDFHSDLEAMTLPISSPSRHASSKKHALVKKLDQKLKGFSSPNGNGVDFFVERGVCQSFGKAGQIEKANILALSNFASDQGFGIAPKQIETLYGRLVQLVFNAGKASWNIDPEEKRITSSELASWLASEAGNVGLPGSKGEKLRRKMEFAFIDAALIETAQGLRRSYRHRSIRAGYLEMSSRMDLEAEAVAVLQQELTALLLNMDRKEGLHFLNDCQQALRDLSLTLPAPTPPSLVSFLYGYMYEVSDRCLHRFSRSQP